MSGIAGIYNLDGRPADGALLRRMTGVMAHRGPDGAGHWVEGPVGLGHRMLHTTPESLLEQQPLTDESGALCLTLDGRVDNRQELRQALQAQGARLRSDTDAELVLRAYEIWGEQCPEKILGDFAFALWDGRRQQLFCARDIMGLKPFYYYSDENTFLFASELQQLLEDTRVPQEPNEGMIAEYLAGAEPSLQETLYRGIFQLPRAHALIVRPGKLRKVGYWAIDWSKAIRYRTDEEYADHFLEIFREAVRCRLRSHRPVAAELSGGLDSSSIVSTAQWLFSQGLVENPGFETFSVAFPGQPWDERSYFQEVVQQWDLKSNIVTEKRLEASSLVQEVCKHRDFPDFPAQEQLFSPVMARVQEKGARVVLSGDGGDQWLGGSLFHTADLLRRLKIREAVRQSRMDSQIISNSYPNAPRSPRYVFLRYGLAPLIPRFVRHGIKWAARKNVDGVPPWIGPQFARQARLAERLREKEIVREQFATVVQRKEIGPLLDYPYYWLMDRHISRFGLEYRHPFLDRRMIEYCLALPSEQCRRPGQTKFVLRQAMRGLLPEKVRTRLGKPWFGLHTYPDAMEALGGERFFDSLLIASLGWVDGKRLQQMYQHAVSRCNQNDGRDSKYLWPLWAAIGIELWFKTVFFNGDIHNQFSTNARGNTQRREEKSWKETQSTGICSEAKAS